MKILLSAYACEPNRGSEPGIGWKWALTLAANSENEVHVITRANNSDVINEYWQHNSKPQSLHFHYYDLPQLFLWAKHHHLPVNIYYACWLYGSSNLAKSLHKDINFDIAHHITFGVYRDAPCLYRLGIPVVIGPVGGGEYTPENLLRLFTPMERAKEFLRLAVNRMSFLNPLCHKAFNQASLILSKTDDTKNDLLRKKWRDKTIRTLEIGIDGLKKSTELERDKDHFIFVGRFTYWKGVKLALLAFRQYCQLYNKNAKLTFIGKGSMDSYISDFAKQNNLSSNINIIKWMNQQELTHYYQSSCALLFPSLHDSSGNVVLESLANGLPVICLKCGGPKSVMGNLTETMIDQSEKSIDQIIDNIATIMHRLRTDSIFYDQVHEKAFSRAKEFIWDENIEKTYHLINEALKNKL